jgi:DNA-directed RNA polymerase I, II, and III subunit RPABC1
MNNSKKVLLDTNDIIINNKKQIEIALKTICRIIHERKYTTKTISEIFSKIKPNITDNILLNIEDIHNDKILFSIDDKKYGIKFISNFLTTIKKEVSIENFLTKNLDIHKFIIINKLSDRAIKQILEYQNTEVFTLDELLIVVIDHHLVPPHYLLTTQEKEEYFTTFNHHPRDMKKILVNDPVAKFYGAKVGDLFKIIRPSITSGKDVDYRIVIPGEIKIDD